MALTQAQIDQARQRAKAGQGGVPTTQTTATTTNPYIQKPGESITDYSARINAMNAQRALLGQSSQKTTYTPPTTTKDVSQGVSGTPSLPPLQSQTVQEQYLQSSLATLQTQQQDYQNALNRQIADTAAQQKAAQAELDTLRSQQETAITSYGTSAMAEKQQKLDTLEEEKKRFSESYDIVQGLAGQLQTILTNGNDLIRQQKEATGLSAIRTPRVNQTISDVTAQAGVIEATISVYNGQMNQAQSQLTNATNVITSAYSDELNYYQTLADFYNTKSADTNQKLITLTKDEKGYLDTQINYLQNQMEITQANAENLKQVLMDPDTALLYTQAGVTLNTPQDQIPGMLAQAAYNRQVQQDSNAITAEGYTYLAPGQNAPAGSDIITRTFTAPDGTTLTKSWYREAEVSEPSYKVTAEDYNIFAARLGNMEAENGYIKYMDDYVTLRDEWRQEGFNVKDFDAQFARYLYRGEDANRENFRKYGIENLLPKEKTGAPSNEDLAS